MQTTGKPLPDPCGRRLLATRSFCQSIFFEIFIQFFLGGRNPLGNSGNFWFRDCMLSSYYTIGKLLKKINGRSNTSGGSRIS